MKKIVITLMIFLFTATATSYGGIFTNNEGSTSQNGALFGSGNSTKDPNSQGDSGFGALFRASVNNPGGRPGNGDAIGQEAPLGDGLLVMTACCVGLVIVKIYNGKRRKKFE